MHTICLQQHCFLSHCRGKEQFSHHSTAVGDDLLDDSAAASPAAAAAAAAAAPASLLTELGAGSASQPICTSMDVHGSGCVCCHGNHD